MPEIEEVIETPFATASSQLGPRCGSRAACCARRYDEAIVLPNSWKSALVPFLAGIPRRVGFRGEARYGLLNVRHRLDEAALPLMAERYAPARRGAGAPGRAPGPAARIEVDEANLADHGQPRSAWTARSPIVALCPGAEYGPAKRWPARHFAALARALAARGRSVWLIGAPGDRAIGEEIAQLAAGAALNLCGRTDLAAAIDLLSVAEVGRHQRLGADARRRGARPAAGRALRLLEPRAHAAARAARARS